MLREIAKNNQKNIQAGIWSNNIKAYSECV